MKMFYKEDNCLVGVYDFGEKSALIFSPSLAGRQNGNGWKRVKINQLIPEEYYHNHPEWCMNTNIRKKIKNRLDYEQATWTCTDGVKFNNCDMAIAHEREIVVKERENNAEFK